MRAVESLLDIIKSRPENSFGRLKHHRSFADIHESYHTMSTVTHYTTLGLLPTAAPEVIRATYKALALLCHPDKTMHLAARERASHAAAFNEVQAAYDVLGNPTLKTAYDVQLGHRVNGAGQHRSTFLGRSSVHTAPEASSTPKRRPTAKLTTPKERSAMRAEARQSLDELRAKRAERDTKDARLDVAGLKDMVQTWEQLAEENKVCPALRAHCRIRIYEYEQKIAEHEQQHKERLTKISTAKQEPSAPTTKQSQSARNAPKKPASSTSTASTRSSSASRSSGPRSASVTTSPTPQSRIGRDEECKRDAAQRAAATAARTEARLLEKAQREAAKQALIDQKVSAVRAEKEKQKAKVELQA